MKLPREFYNRDTIDVAQSLLGKHLIHVVTEREGHAAAVLIRALEPIQHIDARTQGPGLLCNAMHITKQQNGHDLLSDYFYVSEAPQKENFTLIKKPRIGVDYAKHWAKRLLRFYIKNNAYISRK